MGRAWSRSRNFNPRSRMGSDCLLHLYRRDARISIHAPAWGATELDEHHDHRQHISIHAPAWGATSDSVHHARFPMHFNPRSRMGSDVRVGSAQRVCAYFNPRSRMGSDSTPRRMAHRSTYFNPRSRMGSDTPQTSATNTTQAYFNPRSRMGSDPQWHQSDPGITEFQSTLPHGERRYKSLLARHDRLFQSTLPHGERQVYESEVHHADSYFNPRSRMGSDPRPGRTAV